MDHLKQSVRGALESDVPIPRDLVRTWIAHAGDVEADALLYQLTGEAWGRIEPALESNETCALIQRYLFECLREDPQGEGALTRYEAAAELEVWFDQLSKIDGTREIVQKAVAGITELSCTVERMSGEQSRPAFLEHVFEQAS